MERRENNCKMCIVQTPLRIDIAYWICLKRESQKRLDDKSALIQVMAWCRQTASHYMSDC